jgi:Protein of unknown function (DUF3987)
MKNGNANGHDKAAATGHAPHQLIFDRGWPEPMDEDAFHGVAGNIVQYALRPHTEAADEVLLLHLLAFAGNFLGRESYAAADGARHPPNLYALFVGPTASGRKGSAYNQASQFFPGEYLRENVETGLSTGEGLIHAVRDRQTSTAEDGSTKVDDPGVADKRRLIIEDEFSRALRAMNRQDNTLSAILRQAWDGRDLATMTRKNPLRASAAHISVIGHITPEEIRQDLPDISAANGLGNRFLFICSARSKILPFSGTPDSQLIAHLREQLLDAIQYPRRGLFEMDAEARTIWVLHYERLTAPTPRLWGSITARGAPQVLRLALTYALLDRADLIGGDHLRAALSVWKYSQDSARYIFGDDIGDPIADKIAKALRDYPKGLNRTKISALFSNNVSGTDIEERLNLLARHRRATQRNVSTGGRPVELWFPAR